MFLNTFLLYGALLGSVPVIIHLLNRRRFRPVAWAAMEFLLQALQKNARRLQLRDLIMMLLRTLAVIFLALALARPAISAKGFLGATGKTGAIILIDNSLSMDCNSGRETRFERAKRLAKSVLAQLEKGAWCGVYTFNDEVRSPLGDPSQNLAYLEQELDRSVLRSDGGTNIEKALRFADKLFNTHSEYRLGRRELYLITDMQARPWNSREVSGDFKPLLKKMSAEAAVYVINAGDSGTENAAVTELTPTDTLASVDMPVSFVAKIKNFGQTDLKDLRADFFIDPHGKDDKPAERSTVDVPAGGTGSVAFETRFKTGGDHKVEIRLAGDHLGADDRRYCTIEVIDEARFLLVDGREQRGDDPLASETGYLRFALSPQDSENPDKQSVITVKTVQASRIDNNLKPYQGVVLANAGKLDSATVKALDERVREGMGLMIFLGDQTDPRTYEKLLGEDGAKLLPAKIGEPWGEAPTLEQKAFPSVAFGTDKLSHPIMADFRVSDCVELLSKVLVYRAYALEPLASDSVRVVAYLADGKPVILERKAGSGLVYLFAFPATAKWTNMPNQYAFAITLMRIAQQVALGNRPPKNLPVSAPLRGILPLADQNTPVKIIPPPPLPRQETRPEPAANGHAVFEFNSTDCAGFYDVVLERQPKTTLSYALSPAAETESNLNTISSAQLKMDYPGFNFGFIMPSDDFASKLTSERQGTELWPWFMALVFVCLAAESVLAMKWSPRD